MGYSLVNDPTLLLVLRSWSWEPLIILVIASVAAIYVYSMHYYRRQAELTGLTQQGSLAQKRVIRPSHYWYFSAGLLTLFIALQSPIDTFSDQLFVMHMSQHLLLALVVPPLLLLGVPTLLLSSSLNRYPAIKSILARLTYAPVAFIIYSLVLVSWHIPALYEATLTNDLVHELEHAMFFWAGLLSWWPLLSPVRELPRLSYPAQILYIFILAIPAAILGSWLVFSEQIVYPSYATTPALWGISALDDQHLGALMMLVPGKMIYFAALTIIFFRWFNLAEEPLTEEQPLVNNR